MSDNVRDELATELSAIGIRTEHVVRIIDYLLANLAERGMVVLGPDGEPLDVRPLLAMARSWSKFAGLADMAPGSWLVREGLPADLADACLAADEVEP